MTDQHHPITPPPELVEQWDKDCESGNNPEVSNTFYALKCFASKAARWGADQELEACCEWFVRDWTDIETADTLRAARRPKPPSLKEQAMAALDDAVMRGDCITISDALPKIRRALEALPND